MKGLNLSLWSVDRPVGASTIAICPVTINKYISVATDHDLLILSVAITLPPLNLCIEQTAYMQSAQLYSYHQKISD